MIYLADKDVTEIAKLLNEDLEAISGYFYESELLMNLKKGKTESMLFGTSQRLSKLDTTLQLYYRGEKVYNTDTYKYLGNIVDPALNLNLDFDQKYRKASARLRLMTKVRSFLNAEAAKKVYEAMVTPVMTYCHLIHSSITKSQSGKLKSLKSRATEIIGNVDIQDIENTMKLRSCLFVRKCLEKRLCNVFDDYFQVKEHSQNTRNNNSLLVLPRVKLEYERKTLYFYGAKIYNELPLAIRKLDKFNEFESHLKTYFN